MEIYEKIRQSEAIKVYIQRADESLAALGYTEHSFAHVTKAAESVKYILETLGYSEHQVEMGMIAAYLHDIGNVINRVDHAQSGAVMAFRILDNMGADPEDIATIVTAIGNHDEGGIQIMYTVVLSFCGVQQELAEFHSRTKAQQICEQIEQQRDRLIS